MVLRRICILSAVLISACAPQPWIAEPASAPAVTPPQLAAPLPEHGPLLINDYKRTVASRIVAANEEVFFEPLPEMLKSSVLRAAPFDGPQPGVLQGAASVSFLETFLFRGDGFYQVLSLVFSLRDSFSPSLAGASN